MCLINSRAAFEAVQTGDVICYESVAGKKVIHRVVALTDAGIETKGDANEASDGVTTTRDNYIGTVIASVAWLGYVVYWIQTAQGMVLSIALLLILFILAWEPASRRRHRRGGKRRTGKADGGRRDRKRV